MESDTSAVIGVGDYEVVEVAVPISEAGFHDQEPIVSHNHAATALGEPTVVVSPPEENTTSHPSTSTTTITSTYYTIIVQEGGSHDGDSMRLVSSRASESFSVPIIDSSAIDGIKASQQYVLIQTEADRTSDEHNFWTQSSLTNKAGVIRDKKLTGRKDVPNCTESSIGLGDMGTDIITLVSPETHNNMVKLKMCVDKHSYRELDDDDDVHIEVVDDLNSERPGSTITIDSESTSESFSSDAFDSKSDSLNSAESENDKEVRLEIRNDSKHGKGTPNRRLNCAPGDCPLLRIPPPVTRTPLPNLPGIKGTSLAATKPAVISKAIDTTPLNADKKKRENAQTGPILHSVSSILLKENESGNNDTALVRPVPQIRPCFSAFSGLNHQLLSGFSFNHTSQTLPLPPLTVFASPLRVIHPSFSSPQSGLASIAPFSNASFPSTVGLRGTLPNNLPPIRIIPPPFATAAETRRIVRRRRNSGNSKSSEEDPESQKVRRRQANARERDRVTQLNSGFEQLRRVLPWVQQGRRTSKVDTLRAAIAYIDHLQRILWDADHATGYLGGAVAVGKYFKYPEFHVSSTRIE